MNNLKNIITLLLIIVSGFYIYSYNINKQKIVTLEKDLKNKNEMIVKINNVNENNIKIYQEKIEEIKKQIKEIETVNKKQEDRIVDTVEVKKDIDKKLINKTLIEKNKILNEELKKIIGEINEK